MIATLVYYLFSASAVLFYGIGINKSISHSDTFSSTFLTCIKSLGSASSATAVTYLLVNWLLVPVQLSDLFPFIATLVFILFTVLTEIFVGVGIRQSPIDFSIPLLSVFLGISEGISLGLSVVIACTSILSFYCMVLIFHCVRERVSFYTADRGLKTYCVLLLCLALIMISITGFNVSWFNMYLGGGAK